MVAGSNLFKHKILTLCYKFNIVLALGNNGIFKLHLSHSSASSYRAATAAAAVARTANDVVEFERPSGLVLNSLHVCYLC